MVDFSFYVIRVGALSKNKEAMAREKERLLNEIQNAREKYANGLKYTEELEKRNEATELKLSEVSTELEVPESLSVEILNNLIIMYSEVSVF